MPSYIKIAAILTAKPNMLDDVPLLPQVNREQTFHGSYWGNNTDLSEVVTLAAQDKIRHTLKTFSFDQIHEHLDLLRQGEIVGRAVLKF